MAGPNAIKLGEPTIPQASLKKPDAIVLAQSESKTNIPEKIVIKSNDKTNCTAVSKAKPIELGESLAWLPFFSHLSDREARKAASLVSKLSLKDPGDLSKFGIESKERFMRRTELATSTMMELISLPEISAWNEINLISKKKFIFFKPEPKDLTSLLDLAQKQIKIRISAIDPLKIKLQTCLDELNKIIDEVTLLEKATKVVIDQWKTTSLPRLKLDGTAEEVKKVQDIIQMLEIQYSSFITLLSAGTIQLASVQTKLKGIELESIRLGDILLKIPTIQGMNPGLLLETIRKGT